MSCSRENTWPGWAARKASRSNSRWVSATSSPSRITRRPAGSMTRSPKAIGSAGRPPPRADAPQDGVDPRDELARRERLDDVVVGAEAQADDAVGLLALGGEQDDRRRAVVLALAALAQPAHHLEAVDAGQHEIEHDEVGPLLGGELERPLAVARDERRVARVLEVARHEVGDGPLVVDDEDRSADVAVPGQDHGFNRPGARARQPVRARVHR